VRKKSRVLYRSQTVDGDGQLIQEKVVTVEKSRESFVMLRVTGGMEWLVGFRSVVDMKVFVVMASMMDEGNRVTMSGPRRAIIAVSAGCRVSTVYAVIGRLVAGRLMKRLGRGLYMLSPTVVYRTRVEKLEAMQREYAQT
jgi:hypothetical protein